MAKKYTLNVNRRDSRPRSDRLRKLGVTAVAGGGSTVVNVTSSQPVSGDGNSHTHANKSSLDKISVDGESYLYINQLRETADGTGYSTCAEKVRAGHADEAGHATEAEHTVSADTATEAEHAANADTAAEAEHAASADTAAEADNADKWDGRHFDDWMDQPVRKADSVEHREVVTGTLSGAGQFVDGLLGSGYRLWEDDGGLAHLTVDRLTVRQTWRVFELLVEKIRSIGGTMCVSAANGRIKEATQEGDGEWHIAFEGDNTFAPGDQMRCQTSGGKFYWVTVESVDAEGARVSAGEFLQDGYSLPEAGDEVVLMGSVSDTSRQNLILISATEDGQPRIDVYSGVDSKDLSGCLRARLGSLDGISDGRFPADNQPHGDGLYADNAYLRGTFLLTTGEDVKTMFKVTEGKIESSAEALRRDFTEDKGYLSNPTFGDGLDKWDTANEATFFLAGNRWIWANGTPLTRKGDIAMVTKDDGRTVVYIRNKHISQQNRNLRSRPTFTANDGGELEAAPVYLTFFYRCAKEGTLKVGFEDVDKTGFADFDPLDAEETLDVTDGYRQYRCEGLWNGTGDFRLSFTGEIYLYMLVMSADRVDALAYRYRTLFEQSEKMVRIAAQNFDVDGKVLSSSELMTTTEYNLLMSERFNSDGSLKNVAGLVTATQLDDYVKAESFAGLFAQAVADDGTIVKTAALSAYVTKDEDGYLTSEARIHADQVEILSDHFKVLHGDVYADSLTLTGTFNKMLTVVTASDMPDATEAPRTCLLDGSPNLYNSPDWLLTGELVQFSTGTMTNVNLPFYARTPDKECAPSGGDPSPFRYVRTPTRFGTGVWHMMTLAEMRMMVGKKLYLTNTNKNGMITVYYGIPFTVAYNGDLEYITWDGTDDYVSIGILPRRTLIMECRMDGYLSSDGAYYECIWWKYLAEVGQPLVEFTD